MNFVQLEANPSGVHFENCHGLLNQGIRGYFCWLGDQPQGSNNVTINKCSNPNSTREHTVRGTCHYLSIEGSVLGNLDFYCD